MSLPKRLLEQLDLKRSAHGDVRLFSFDMKSGELIKLIRKSNLVLYGGADILSQLIAGHNEYRLSTMYIEFRNLALPGDPAPAPAFDRSGGIGYYNGLSSDPDVDFLRIPMAINPLIDSSDVLYSGNQATFFAISEGMAGFHGKTFGASANSAVFGAALVAAPDPEDQSQDLVFSRLYSGIDKIEKVDGQEIGVTWTIRFN